MPTWSRDHSQARGGLSPLKSSQFGRVKCLGNLQATSDKQKAAQARDRRKAARPPEEVKRVREFDAPMRADYKPARRRGANCCRLSDAKREALNVAKVQRHHDREAFFAALGEV